MKKTFALTLVAALLLALCACNHGESDDGPSGSPSPTVSGSPDSSPSNSAGGEQNNGTGNEPDDSSGNGAGSGSDSGSDNISDNEPGEDGSGGASEPPGTQEPPKPTTLERGPDGILIGSMVFDEPLKLVGAFGDGETEENVINVREEPNTDSEIVGQINYRKVVEATEVVNGWYHVTVLPEMLSGYIRSDLLTEYTDQSAHNRAQFGSAVFEEPIMLISALSKINVRDGPGSEYELVTTMSLGQVAEASEVVDGWYHITVLPGMFTGYTYSELLVEYIDTRQFYAVTREDSIEVQQSGGGAVTKESVLVDVRYALPDIQVHMILATPDNYAGRPLYSRDVCILQSGTIEKLAKALEIFRDDGYTIKIYDAYRPSSVSGILSDLVQDPNYVAAAGASVHNRAAAIDMTLVDSDGNELEMPSPMHTFNSTSHRDSTRMSSEARKNMDYMASVMKQCGFTTVQSEWWHFSDSDSSKYPPLDLSFDEFLFYYVDN